MSNAVRMEESMPPDARAHGLLEQIAHGIHGLRFAILMRQGFQREILPEHMRVGIRHQRIAGRQFPDVRDIRLPRRARGTDGEQFVERGFVHHRLCRASEQ